MYIMPELSEYKEQFGDTKSTELMYYQTYLNQTDYVACKLAEAAYSGQVVAEDYTDILAQREVARQKINNLNMEV